MKYIVLRSGRPIPLDSLRDLVGWWWLDPCPEYQIVRVDRPTQLLNELRGVGALIGAQFDDGLRRVHYG